MSVFYCIYIETCINLYEQIAYMNTFLFVHVFGARMLMSEGFLTCSLRYFCDRVPLNLKRKESGRLVYKEAAEICLSLLCHLMIIGI